MGTSVAHIDASPILVLVFLEDGLEDVRKMFYDMRGNSFRVVISQLVLGEIVVQILERDMGHDERMGCFGRLYQLFSDYGIDVQDCLPNVSVRACELMVEIRRGDPMITENDAMILAMALADPESKFFITWDNTLLDNLWIGEFERKLRERGERRGVLKVRDSI